MNLFPTQKPTFDAQLAASLAQIGGEGNDQSVQRGLAWGKQVADEILAWRAGDGISSCPVPVRPGARRLAADAAAWTACSSGSSRT